MPKIGKSISIGVEVVLLYLANIGLANDTKLFIYNGIKACVQIHITVKCIAYSTITQGPDFASARRL